MKVDDRGVLTVLVVKLGMFMKVKLQERERGLKTTACLQFINHGKTELDPALDPSHLRTASPTVIGKVAYF